MEDKSRMKKRLQSFLGEMVKLGTVAGFKYFSTYIRGREEMVISILNEPDVIVTPSHRRDSLQTECLATSLTSQHLPYDKRSLMLSQRTQMSLSGRGEQGIGLPPASPSDHETHSMDAGYTVFLIAGYTRYSCPYVWVRSNHDRLVRLTGEDAREKDNPLRLKSTAKWTDTEVYIWDVIAELVRLCTYPAPRNPFEVDLAPLSSLPLTQQVLATASLAELLHKILLHSHDKPYAAKVFEDVQCVMRHHYKALQELTRQQTLPVLHQQHQQQQHRHQQFGAGKTGTPRSNYVYSH